MAKGLTIAEPPKRKPTKGPAPEPTATVVHTNKFAKIQADTKVQFNKRISQSAVDGYAILSATTHKKIPELLEEGLELLQQKYGKV